MIKILTKYNNEDPKTFMVSFVSKVGQYKCK